MAKGLRKLHVFSSWCRPGTCFRLEVECRSCKVRNENKTPKKKQNSWFCHVNRQEDQDFCFSATGFVYLCFLDLLRLLLCFLISTWLEALRRMAAMEECSSSKADGINDAWRLWRCCVPTVLLLDLHKSIEFRLHNFQFQHRCNCFSRRPQWWRNRRSLSWSNQARIEISISFLFDSGISGYVSWFLQNIGTRVVLRYWRRWYSNVRIA